MTYPSTHTDSGGNVWQVTVKNGGHLVQFKSSGVHLELPRQQVLGEDEVPKAFEFARRVITCGSDEWRVRWKDTAFVFERPDDGKPKLRYEPPRGRGGFAATYNGLWRLMNEAALCDLLAQAG